MWRRLAEAWSRPRGYRPGATLARLRSDWPGLEGEAASAAEQSFAFPHGVWSFLVRERVEAGWMAHLVACEFCLSLPVSDPVPARIRLRHRGAWRRQGVAVDLLAGDAVRLAPLLQALRADADVCAALMPLDFRRCELRGGVDGWSLLIEPFGASEVVCLLPPLRRYIRLGPIQRLALLASMAACRRVLLALN
ncbi:hypothetical protein VI26_10815 [Chromobacterium sp. LK1]|uniref:DUF3156 family protein n=1 Tax=Chromobacterium sp. LK1 TaxID=1628193 RepID=UPI0006544F92|nr:DUF3156 family protein [Chromobacterium sp. LK1]KMN35580.1 hypothetical protein VI26_10815 [Chromobacterium sp. LK1]